MKHLIFTLAALFALILPLSAQKKSDQKAIEGLVTAYQDALNNNSLDGIVAVFASDAVVLPNSAPPASGTDAIRKHYQGVVDAETMDISLGIQDVVYSGDVAYGWLMNSGSVKWAGSDETVNIQSKSLVVFAKTGDGWRIHRYMFNNNSN